MAILTVKICLLKLKATSCHLFFGFFISNRRVVVHRTDLQVGHG